ncbi:hypothetical protein CN306_18790 [Bacillus thuringiensis]|uniref:hypothetical protein n=1 Tax=Bacillus thuringiensis TaxID=1428 RepID=UPI000BF4B707|nr:hypothetical protein [Bacillus thuringiensis]PFD89218.1 hypothetical protein CN306_18790 [Bacillus thuringiensis]
MSYTVDFNDEKVEINDFKLEEEQKCYEKEMINSLIDKNDVVFTSIEVDENNSDYGNHMRVTYIFRKKKES